MLSNLWKTLCGLLFFEGTSELMSTLGAGRDIFSLEPGLFVSSICFEPASCLGSVPIISVSAVGVKALGAYFGHNYCPLTFTGFLLIYLFFVRMFPAT